jgi:hypothetical protein
MTTRQPRDPLLIGVGDPLLFMDLSGLDRRQRRRRLRVAGRLVPRHRQRVTW